MATILLLIIYIAFIGLGIPDSLFGTAWPAIYTELGLPVSSASCVTLLISGGTVVSSLLSAKLIRRLGTGKVTALSTAVTAFALLGFSLSGGLVWLCLFAVPLGLGAGAVDTALNNYVALHYKAIHMNFLHCFYGIGVSLSPGLMAVALSGSSGWRGGYRLMFFIQLAIAVILTATLPLWKRAHGSEQGPLQEENSRPAGLLSLLKRPAVRAVLLIFIGSCALEYTCGVWGSTFLVQARGMPASAAAGLVTLYYVGMAVGRFLSGLLSRRLTSWTIIGIGQILTLAAVVLLCLPLPPEAAGAGLCLVGLGNGPLFPNLLHLTPQNFGRELSQPVMSLQMAASYIGILAMPPLFGLLAQQVGAWLMPWFLLAMFGIMIGGTARMRCLLRRRTAAGRYPGERD